VLTGRQTKERVPMSKLPRFDEWTCPLPLRHHPSIVMAHGGGGSLTADLVEHLFAPAFRNETLDMMGDSAVVDLPAGATRLAFSTDSYVVQPLFFPGGSIGELAVHGTVNDLAMSGARPLFMSAGFILEEGLPLKHLGEIVRRMSEAAKSAGILLVTGDTKVVEKGRGDGCFINTSGVGVVPAGLKLGPHLARPGDAVLVSGRIGDHGVAILSVREGMEFETAIVSDTAALNGLVAAILAATSDLHVLRDPTRGGVAATLNEIASRSKVGIDLDDRALPVSADVESACELLGLDLLTVANEGKLVAVVAPDAADPVLDEFRRHPLGALAARIGTVTDQHPGLVAARTKIGGMRVIPMPRGEQLPRIC
jgi:hydrogenase expression/formation protein HypE